MNSLATLQEEFQSFVLDADPSVQSQIVSTREVSAADRLAIYGDAYRLRLIDALASNYPRLKQAIGDAGFNAIALRYIQTQRSHHPSIRWYGDRLSVLLASDRANEPWLAELAKWEWAVAAAFDARDAEIIDATSLAHIEPDQWSSLRLAFHPSLQRVDLHSNAAALFKAFTEESVPPTPQVDTPSAWLIWRQDLKTQYRSLPQDEAAMLDLMRAEGSFGDACELLCDWHDAESVPLQAATYMQRWLHDELVCALL